MPPAVIAGGIAAAGTIGGAIIGSKAQKSAASQANASQQAATDAQLQLGRESMALNQAIYNSNYNTLSPFVSRGNVAGDAINALLGLPAAPRMTSPLAGTGVAPATAGGAAPAPAPNPLASEWARIRGYIGDGISDNFDPAAIAFIRANESRIPANYGGPSLQQIQSMYGDGISGNAQAALSRLGSAIASNAPAPAPSPAAPAAPATPATPAVTPQTAQSALNNFANSAGMQFQLKQGADMLNNRYAAAGALQSGAAMKAMQGYGQKTALNNYFMPYMGLLSGQQAVGAGSASSIAGVGSNFGNTAAAINAGMGSSIQNGADAASNAALLRGQANANMWGSIGGALGGLASSFVPSGGGGITVNNPYLPLRY